MFVISWNIGVWYSGNKQQKCNCSWETVWEKCEGWGALPVTRVFSGAHYAADPGHPLSHLFSSSSSRRERAFFSPIYNIIFCFSSFLPLLFFSFLSFLRGGKTKQEGKFLWFLALWWNFQGCQIINTSFLTLKVKTV